MIKSVLDRIPLELYNLKMEIWRTNKCKKKIEAYKTITNISRPIINMNKKAQLFDAITLFLMVIVFVIALGICMFTLNAFNSAYQLSEPDPTLQANLNTYTSSTGSWWDFSFALFFFLYLIVLIALNFFLGTLPFYIIFQFVFLIVVGFIFIALHNVANTIMEAFPTVFNLTSMPLTYFIVDKMFYIVIVFYLFCVMSLFMKPKSSAEMSGV